MLGQHLHTQHGRFGFRPMAVHLSCTADNKVKHYLPCRKYFYDRDGRAGNILACSVRARECNMSGKHSSDIAVGWYYVESCLEKIIMPFTLTKRF